MKIVSFILLLMVANISFGQKIDPTTAPEQDTSSKIFEKAEIEASVDVKLWVDHLTQSLQPFILKAAKKGMKAGTYIVQVKFLVERDGRITDVQALNDPGYGLAKGAEKAIKTGPKWIAGEVNGKKVRSYHTQPVTFVIQEM